MATPFFVADSARVTILRPLASSAFGTYALGLPEGIDIEDVHDFEAPGNELGHVSNLTQGRRVGGLARRFVRADVSVTADDPSDPDDFPASDVDAVLTAAAKQVASDFFLESDISKAGLGPWVPFVDFQVGDTASVEVWGHVVTLPVTRIEQFISDHDLVDWRVHVGGQLVSDEDARLVENEALRKALIQDRRELAGIEAATQRQVAAAQEAADTAKGTADGIVEDLTGVPGGSIVEAPASGAGTLGLMQSEIDAAQWAQLRLHQDQFLLHDNQLKWLSWTKHVYDFRFSLESSASTRLGNEISTGLIDVKLNSAAGMGYEITTRPGWRGLWRFEWSEEGGEFSSGAISGEADGTRTAAVAYSYETDKVIRVGRVFVWPEYSPAPREWVVQVIPGDAGEPRFVAPETTSGSLSISGAPEQVEEGGIRLNSPVIADSDVRIGASGTVYSSGIQLNAGWYIRPLVDGDEGVVRFTEVKPALTWEAGAPLTGRQFIPIASQTIPQSTWVTLAEWTGLDWSSARTATITYEVQWAKYNAWALADYYTRVTLNGEQIGYIARGTTGGMDAYFRMVLTDRTVAAGDVLKFEARATPGFASERKISSASADIVWS